jgi:hypothetical protein
MIFFQFSSFYLAYIAAALMIPIGWLTLKRKTPVVAIISMMIIKNLTVHLFG